MKWRIILKWDTDQLGVSQLKAEGYELAVQDFFVTPGRPTYVRGIELTPE